jgi:anti-sigma B factor antagonist
VEINTTIDGANATIAIVGNLTVVTAPKLEAAFAALPGDASDLVLDLSNLDYVASAGLRVVVSQAKSMQRKGGSMRITNPNDEVMEVFDVTGLVDILEIER